MAKVVTFLYSESVQIENMAGSNEHKAHLIGPLTNFTPAFIPTAFSFGVTFGVLDIDLSTPHTIRYIFKSHKSDDKLLIDTGVTPLQITIPENKKDLPIDMQGFVFNMDVRNVNLEHEGEYKSEVFIDGISLGEFPIKAKAVKI